MLARFWKLVLCAVVLTVYAAIGLSSRRFEPQPLWASNGVVPLRGDGLFFFAPGMAWAAHPPEWLPAVVEGASIEIIVRIRSYQEQQFGPARILTISRDAGHRNLTIGQHGDALVIRLRTVATTVNGLPAYEIPGVFDDVELHTIVVTIDEEMIRVIVDGSVRWQDPLPDNPLMNWDPSYPLILGNEMGGQRPWLGEIRRATVRVQGRVFEYAETESLAIPEYFHLRGRVPRSPHYAFQGNDLRWRDNLRVAVDDAVKNLYGFIPLGCLLIFLWRRHRIISVIIICGVLSIIIEVTQLVVPGRSPQISDFVLNVLGGALGAVMGKIFLTMFRSGRRNVFGPWTWRE